MHACDLRHIIHKVLSPIIQFPLPAADIIQQQSYEPLFVSLCWLCSASVLKGLSNLYSHNIKLALKVLQVFDAATKT